MNARRGMTLLELAVALAVGGAALAAGGAAFATLIDRRAALLAEDDRALRATAARRLLTAWIGAAGSGGLPGVIVLPGVQRNASGVRAADTIEVRTLIDGKAAVLRLLAKPESPGALIALRETARTVTVDTLVTGVQSFMVRVRTSAYGRTEWRREWRGTTLRPEVIELRLTGDSLPALWQLPVIAVLGNAP